MRPIDRIHLDELVVIRDFGQNAYKRRRYELLSSRLGSRVQRPGAERVFIRRGVTGQNRAMVNANEVETYLISQGYCVIEPEHLSPTQIAAATWGARVAIGIEGSHMAHAVLTMAAGGVLCCLQPPWRFTAVLREFTYCRDIRYAIVVGHAVEAGGFRVDIDELKHTLERIETVLPHTAGS